MTEQAQGEATTAAETQETQSEATQETQPFFVAQTQADLNKKVGDLRKEVRGAILKDLGVEKLDDLKGIVEDHRAVQQATESEVEALQRQLNEEKTSREQAISKANARVISTELRSALRNAGVPEDRLKFALKNADTSEVEVDDEGNVSGLDGVVETLKEEAAFIFGEPAPQTVGRGSSPGSGSGGAAPDFAGMSSEEFTAYANRVAAGERIVP